MTFTAPKGHEEQLRGLYGEGGIDYYYYYYFNVWKRNPTHPEVEK